MTKKKISVKKINSIKIVISCKLSSDLGNAFCIKEKKIK